MKRLFKQNPGTIDLKPFDYILKNIATLGPAGYSPFAPGTVGTAVTAILCLFFATRTSVLLIIPLLFIMGTIASDRAEGIFEEKDSSYIVIDEATGFLVTIAFHSITPLLVLIGFVLFRFFDILKPFPIRQAETRLPGGLGVMFDDIMAGIYANIVLTLVLYFKDVIRI
ncbi:MAG: phosphatidylglycerophosphatase A [Nitrospirae bacterium]|nr:phosphatidylglycerophosphatase A [Nitrospirota bacterium]